MKHEPREFGQKFEEMFFSMLLAEMEERDEWNQRALAEAAFGVADANRKWHRLKGYYKKKKSQRMLLTDAVALVVALELDVPGFFLTVHHATKQELSPKAMEKGTKKPISDGAA